MSKENKRDILLQKSKEKKNIFFISKNMKNYKKEIMKNSTQKKQTGMQIGGLT